MLSQYLSMLRFSPLFLLWASTCFATTFPYATRTKDYSSWSPASQSDTNTTGMAGATVALPSSISSAEYNPAGYAMETGSLSAQINRISITDKRIQPDGQSIDSSQWGLGLSPPPWGFSLSYYSPMTESDSYFSPNTFDPLKTEVSLKELRATVARSFWNGHVAIGVSAELDKAVRELGSFSYNSYAPSFALGALFRMQDHFIFGVSYLPPLTIGAAPNQPDQAELPGFNRAVLRPSQLDFGVGWVPNRFFKAGASLSYVGDTANTALLYDQSVITGATPTWVPRLGASYVLAEFSNFKSELALGSYYASSRLEGESNRFHATSGWDINPYFINIGLGFDLASDYKNIMIGVGIDIVRTLRTFNIIPKDPTPPLNGFLPNAKHISADGLPDTMTIGEKKSNHPVSLGDVKQIVEELPTNISDKVKGIPTTVEKKEAKAAKKKHPKKRKKKKPPEQPLGNQGGFNLNGNGNNQDQ
jgi:hypothetical protein